MNVVDSTHIWLLIGTSFASVIRKFTSGTCVVIPTENSNYDRITTWLCVEVGIENPNTCGITTWACVEVIRAHTMFWTLFDHVLKNHHRKLKLWYDHFLTMPWKITTESLNFVGIITWTFVEITMETINSAWIITWIALKSQWKYKEYISNVYTHWYIYLDSL